MNVPLTRIAGTMALRDPPVRPSLGRVRIPPGALVLAAAAALTIAGVVERRAAPPARGAGVEVERQAARAEEIWITAERRIGAAKAAAGLPTDSSPLVGEELTPLVTTLGSLKAKRAASRSAWAPTLTRKLAEKGVRHGSVVAASFSGSFPGLNLALAAACQALGADLVAVSSVTASTWGANQPGFTWPEMEALLVEAGELRRVSAAISPGGMADNLLDLEPEARALALRIQRTTAQRLSAACLNPAGLDEAVARRMAIYDDAARGRRIVLYANVGGSEVSLGSSAAVLRLRSGFLPDAPFDLGGGRGVMARFAERGIPVLSLLNIEELARRWSIE